MQCRHANWYFQRKRLLKSASARLACTSYITLTCNLRRRVNPAVSDAVQCITTKSKASISLEVNHRITLKLHRPAVDTAADRTKGFAQAYHVLTLLDIYRAAAGSGSLKGNTIKEMACSTKNEMLA
ncbi:hypothetical protein N7G274_010543 [Stereocaulon virgatum]|uniref:Uncharacterized protein n=1 Tax=Stereocaulon virgatum TaxID=373712 RepID=A0ABR3ZU54_9LECA